MNVDIVVREVSVACGGQGADLQQAASFGQGLVTKKSCCYANRRFSGFAFAAGRIEYVIGEPIFDTRCPGGAEVPKQLCRTWVLPLGL
jgi:hypothetical protein